MLGLILCAGKGTRLRPITYFKPKCMVEVGGKPVLEHLVDHLHKYGVTEIMINTHHKPMQIMRHFGTGLLYTYEPKLIGEQGTINSLSGWMLAKNTVVMNGDTLTNIDINKMYRLSGGRSIRSMEGKTYTGTKILTPDYFLGDRKFIDYQSVDTKWYDMGTHKGLKKARIAYEKEFIDMSHLS